jgi:FeS assembly protein IscX
MAKPPNAPLRRSPWRTSQGTQQRLERRTLKWIDINHITSILYKQLPDIDFDLLPDLDIKQHIIALPTFADTPHPPHGFYYDLVRAAWNDLRETNTLTPNPKQTAQK